MRGKGEGSVFRVPKDPAEPLKYWTGIVELPAHDGVRRRKPIRRKSKRDLLVAMAEMKEQLRIRGDLPTKDQTVEQWFSYWLREVASKEVRPNTLDQYEHSSRHVIAAIGKVRLDKLSALHMRRVYDRMTIEQGLSSTTALLAHRTMAMAFKTAVREGRIGRNPTDLVNPPRRAVAPQEAFDMDEAIRVLEHVASDPEMGARWATALLTGARRGEVLGMELNRISDEIDLSWQLQRFRITATPGVPDAPADFEYRHLTGGLYLTRPKSRAGWRTTPLVEPLKSILERHIENSPPNPWGLVFTINNRPIDPDRDSKNWRAVLAATGINRDVPLHGLRHTAVDLLYAAGVPEDLIMEIVGQSTRATTRGYKSRGSVNRARMVGALEMYSAQFMRLDQGKHREVEE
jgi:integrase